jgi:hypothetical protein
MHAPKPVPRRCSYPECDGGPAIGICHGDCRLSANCPCPPEPFTLGMLLAVLREVLKGDVTLPVPTTIAPLMFCLNGICSKVKGWAGPWREEQKQLAMAAEAIRILIEFLPTQRNIYVALAGASERLCKKEAAAKTQADLAALDSLISAARVARKRGLPLTLNAMLVAPSPTEGWTDIAEELRELFHSVLPDASKEAGYRFVKAVVPTITGESPSFDAIKTVFKRHRLPNRGKRIG